MCTTGRAVKLTIATCMSLSCTVLVCMNVCHVYTHMKGNSAYISAVCVGQGDFGSLQIRGAKNVLN